MLDLFSNWMDANVGVLSDPLAVGAVMLAVSFGVGWLIVQGAVHSWARRFPDGTGKEQYLFGCIPGVVLGVVVMVLAVAAWRSREYFASLSSNEAHPYYWCLLSLCGGWFCSLVIRRKLTGSDDKEVTYLADYTHGLLWGLSTAVMYVGLWPIHRQLFWTALAVGGCIWLIEFVSERVSGLLR